MRIGEQIELTLEKLALGGEAVARTDAGMVVFVQGGIPGDRALVEITKRKRQFAVGKIVALREPSSLRMEARCEYFGRCGGCKWQCLRYPDQLRFKQQVVEETFKHLGKIQDLPIREIRGMESPWYYRNKMEFSFGTDEQGTIILGQHVAGRWDRLVDLEQCYLQSERSVEILALCREFVRKQGLSVYSTETESGLLRHLVVREGKHTGDLMVNLVISGEYFPQLDRFVHYLVAGCPQITSILLTVNRRKAHTPRGQEEHLIFGDPTIRETVNSLEFEISAGSFFQTNTLQTERLYQTIQRMTQPHAQGTALDLYCGTGAIALHLATLMQTVYGVELVEEAVRNAEQNAERNHIENVSLYCGEVQKVLPDFLEYSPDVVVIDPPRPGLSKKVVRDILKLHPRQVIYVSCNPATLARDVAMFTKQQYVIQEVQPVDMFPHTYHIETIVDLRTQHG